MATAAPEPASAQTTPPDGEGPAPGRLVIRWAACRVVTGMTVLLIILAAVAIPYVAFNIRRLRRGRKWAFTVCQVAKEWEQREHEKRVARRVAATGSTRPRQVPSPGASRPG